MVTVSEHYASHLAPIYLWMAGGMDAALGAGEKDLADMLPGSGLALDLGAGFGMHSIPLARAGFRVVAVDSSAVLLRTLEEQGAGLQIRVVEADLLNFRKVVSEPATLIVCMGDTLTHLQSIDEVKRLCADVSRSLAPNGRFVATFRDYSSPAQGDRRFIPVRSDAERILTCFLEESPEHITVHDLIHERDGARWNFKVSSYRKLRLSPALVDAALRMQGLTTQWEPGPRGMVRIVARA
jgi:SAM-dependent methyltransferase